MSVAYLSILGCLILISLCLWWDLVVVRRLIRSYAQADHFPRRLSCFTAPAADCITACRTIFYRAQQHSRSAQVLQQSLESGSDIVKDGGTVERIASQLIDKILDRERAEIVGSAVLLKTTSELVILSSANLANHRMRTLLSEMCAAFLATYKQEESLTDPQSMIAFGIRRSYFFKMPSNFILWVGCQRELEPEALEFIRALGRHLCCIMSLAVNLQEERESFIRYLRGLSHDLKAPTISALAIISPLLDSSGRLPAPFYHSLQSVQILLQQQNNFIHNFTDSLRTEKITPNTIQFNPTEVLDDLAKMFSVEANLAGLNFRYQNISSAIIDFDIEHFRRILANLLSNAIKYTPTGAIELECLKFQQYLFCRVRDTGIGIPPELESSLFREFTRLSHTKDGTGLGLTVAKSLAEANNATLSYTPNPDKGSQFTLSCKLSVEICETNRYRSILVIDDCSALGQLHTSYLLPIADSIHYACRFQQAIALIGTQDFDLIVADLNLPDNHLAAQFWELAAKIPCLLVSGTKPLDCRPGVSYLQKPVSRSELIQAALAVTRPAPAIL